MEKVHGILVKCCYFGVDNSSTSHFDNLQGNFLILGKDPTQGINDRTDATEKKLILNLVKQIQKSD